MERIVAVESERAAAAALEVRKAVEVRMEVERAKFAKQPANTDAAGAIAPLPTWVGKRVRGINGTLDQTRYEG